MFTQLYPGFSGDFLCRVTRAQSLVFNAGGFWSYWTLRFWTIFVPCLINVWALLFDNFLFVFISHIINLNKLWHLFWLYDIWILLKFWPVYWASIPLRLIRIHIIHHRFLRPFTLNLHQIDLPGLQLFLFILRYRRQINWFWIFFLYNYCRLLLFSNLFLILFIFWKVINTLIVKSRFVSLRIILNWLEIFLLRLFEFYAFLSYLKFVLHLMSFYLGFPFFRVDGDQMPLFDGFWLTGFVIESFLFLVDGVKLFV